MLNKKITLKSIISLFFVTSSLFTLGACKPSKAAKVQVASDAHENASANDSADHSAHDVPAKQEWHTMPSGLRYTILKEGHGKRPTANSIVTVHYSGHLLDNTKFDGTSDKPAKFPLNRTILGWQEGLQLMKEGSTFLFVIPPELAYGKSGAGSLIPPNSTLLFYVELLHVE